MLSINQWTLSIICVILKPNGTLTNTWIFKLNTTESLQIGNVHILKVFAFSKGSQLYFFYARPHSY